MFEQLQAKPVVLIAEDEAPIRFLTETVMRREGFEVLSAACGKEALSLFSQRASEIRLLITDISLPNLRGTELAEKVREIRPDLPVIFSSGSFRLEPISHDGFVRDAVFLAKPFEPRQLLHTVNTLLKPQSAGRRPLQVINQYVWLL